MKIRAIRLRTESCQWINYKAKLETSEKAEKIPGLCQGSMKCMKSMEHDNEIIGSALEPLESILVN